MSEHCENQNCPHEQHEGSVLGGIITIMVVGAMLFGAMAAVVIGSSVIAWFLYRPVEGQQGSLRVFSTFSVLAAWLLCNIAAYDYLHPTYKEIDLGWSVNSAANLREGPSIEETVITVVQPGEVQHLEAVSDWHKVKIGGTTGYIHKSLLSHQSQKMELPKRYWFYLAILASFLAVCMSLFCWWYVAPIELEPNIPFDRDKFNEKFTLAMTKLAAVRGYVDYHDMVEEDKAALDAKKQAKIARKVAAAKLRKCEGCGANLSYKHGHLYCEYCGTQYK